MEVGRFKAKSRAWAEQMEKQGRKPAREETRAFGNTHRHEPNKDTIARMSDRRYHYMGRGRTCCLMGQAFGKAMLEMIDWMMVSSVRPGRRQRRGRPSIPGKPGHHGLPAAYGKAGFPATLTGARESWRIRDECAYGC